MDEHSLNKLYYIDKQKYEQEYDARFNSGDAIHLDIKISGNDAFLCQTTQMLKSIVSIERTDKEINRLCDLLPPQAIYQFSNRCLIDEIVLTNNIEGVHSTRKEIKDILNDLSKKNRRHRFYGLVNKYRVLMNSNTEPIPMDTCQDIRKIYDDLFLEEIKATDAGNVPDGLIFRKSSVSVYDEMGKEIHKGLNPESNIIDTMQKSLTLLKRDDVDILIRISLLHYLFGYIHPFYDGNGRTSRFISSYLLSRELNSLISFRISYTIKENIQKYYKAFKICNHPNNKGDLTPFVEMFLNVVDISQSQLCSALSKRVDLLRRYRGILENMPTIRDITTFELYYVLVQAALFSDLGICLKELEEHLEMSYNTLQKHLKKIPENLLIKTKQNKLVYYRLNLEELSNYTANQSE